MHGSRHGGHQDRTIRSVRCETVCMGRGHLHVLLGVGPGVGTTRAMLWEGRRLRRAGRRVLIGVVEDNGWPDTAALVHGLGSVPRHTVRRNGVVADEMDLDALLRSSPDVALVDDLAHTNAPGSRNAKRWQDVEELRDAGIDVVTTVGIEHIESLTDVVRGITGVVQRETVPDHVVRHTDRVEMVDAPPAMLFERLSEGRTHPREGVGPALSGTSGLGSLTALRELALRWLAVHAQDAPGASRDHRTGYRVGIEGTARERVVVALTGGTECAPLLQRGAHLLARSGGGELLAIHVTPPGEQHFGQPGVPTQQRDLVEQLGGTYHQVVGEDVASAVLAFARSVEATQLVVGSTRRSRLAQLFGGPGVGIDITRAAGPIDVHVVGHVGTATSPKLPRMGGGLTWQRQLAGFVLALVASPLATWGLAATPGVETLTTSALAYQLLVVVVALVGGVWPALLAAVASGLTLDYFLIPPVRTVSVAEPEHAVALTLFIVIALLVSFVVDRSARRARLARRATAEADLLSSVAGGVLREQDTLHALVSTTREAFGLAGVRLVRPRTSGAPTILASDGEERPEAGRRRVRVDDTTFVELDGRGLDASEQRLLGVIVTQIRTTLDHRDLEHRASEVEPLEAANKVRSALLSAVSHDIRRPLTAATAAVSGLQSVHDQLTDADREDLLAVAGKGLSDLTGLVTDLLDITRMQAGVFPVAATAMDASDVILPAMDEVGLGPGDVELDLEANLPHVCADPALLRRILVNLLSNARRYTPAGRTVRLATGSSCATVQIRVVDHGTGVPPDRREDVFTPFQRLGDTDNSTGLGLGLALSRGFAEGMGGTLVAEETPGGGLTMVVSLPCVGAPTTPPPPQGAPAPVSTFQATFQVTGQPEPETDAGRGAADLHDPEEEP